MRPIPQSVCSRLELLCRAHTQRAAGEIVGLSETMVSRIAKRGFRAAGTKPMRPMPLDYTIQAEHMTARELAVHYDAAHSLISRWNRLVGRQPKYRSVRKIPMRPHEEIIAAIAKHGVIGAAAEFGISRELLLRWRKTLGITHRGSKRQAASQIGWVERYVEQQRAAA